MHIKKYQLNWEFADKITNLRLFPPHKYFISSSRTLLEESNKTLFHIWVKKCADPNKSYAKTFA